MKMNFVPKYFSYSYIQSQCVLVYFYVVHEYAMTFHHKFVSDVAFNDVMIPFVWLLPRDSRHSLPAGRLVSPYYYVNYGAAESVL